MNKKLKRYVEEEERTVAKITELQEHLKTLRIAKKQEEDAEIIRSIRSMKLDGRTLFNVLNGIQDGGVDVETLLRDASNHVLTEDTISDDTEKNNTTDAKEASESEDENEKEE